MFLTQIDGEHSDGWSADSDEWRSEEHENDNHAEKSEEDCLLSDRNDGQQLEWRALFSNNLCKDPCFYLAIDPLANRDTWSEYMEKSS